MEIKRKNTRKIKVGNIFIGGDSPVSIQTMTKVNTKDLKKLFKEIRLIEKEGADLLRVGVPDIESAKLLDRIKENMNIPLIADIHYDWRIAVEAINRGVDKIRINPANIGAEDDIRKIIKEAVKKNIAIRIGVNSGSFKKINFISASDKEDFLLKKVIEYIRLFEKFDFENIVISVKTSDIRKTVSIYRKLSSLTDYPLHLGITEAGSGSDALIKSSIGIGSLLLDGIGDTIRVSLTASSVEEVRVANRILILLGIRKSGIEIISCPTCSRCRIDLRKIVDELRIKIDRINDKFKTKKIKVAIMGCEVNGPGEAKDADIGIAGGKNSGLLFISGKPIQKVTPDKWIDVILNELKKLKG